MATAFKQTIDNGRSLVATAPAPATSGTSLVVTAADGAKFPAPGNGFWATIWNATSFPDPTNDTAREIVLVTARSTDTFTITRAQLGTAARTVTTADTIALLDVSQLFIDHNTAINALENATTTKPSWAVIAGSGGDYTTLGAAYTAGSRNFLVTPGTYNETTGTLSAWAATVNIFGMDRDTCIIQLASGVTGNLKLSSAGSQVRDITIKEPNTNTTNQYDGWTMLTGANCNFDNVLFLGQDSASNTGSSIAVKAGSSGSKFVNCEFRNASSTGAMHITAVSGLLIDGCLFTLNQGFCIGISAAAASPGGTIEKIRIANSYFNNAGSTNSLRASSVGAGVQSIIVTGCHFKSTISAAPPAIAMQMSGNALTNDGQIITNNIIENTGATGTGCITVSSDTGLIVSNNILLKAGTGTGDPCLYVAASTSFSVVGNQITCTAASTSGMLGIGGGKSEGDISGNFITGFLGANSRAIDLSYQGNVRTTVTNNHIANSTTGIKDTGANGNLYSGNIFKSDVTTPYSVTLGNAFLDDGYTITKAAGYTMTINDGTVLTDSTAAASTITLPTAVGIPGKIFTVKDWKGQAATNNITVATTSSQTIDGAASKVINTNYGYYRLKSDNANWSTL